MFSNLPTFIFQHVTRQRHIFYFGLNINLSAVDIILYVQCRFAFSYNQVSILSKIEKVPRGIRGEKSSKDMASSRNLVSTIGALASPKIGDGTRCPEG